ncbi:ribosomal RNA-processing protein 9 [Cryptococcus neoformans AD2-60a]|uniref:Ribosomal RNA-processing protein 9 n=1 Tax=Cryptococcus neoformans Tu259-1 TaxID=1230072 RepID=A0A854Q7I4_CRYNE|nr:ribosomal RNA-processing protein 9 [Cryptococcus neoformans var. grubii AD2-60a]OXC82408.1 ribosomal RNA-processing protein 9 [Cryptococcus neoformans var. grubii AD1-7a]OXG13669.1 ribosomal RNA-processing protein 9 [Cryptococcus neoformans var. grubii Tu259-1]OXG27990.1 ribosomal RNA-processing protein 9 [Cryptococcus neoformans var. grubii Bt15]OXG76671.1 ribosomal RNA-processing protein 9 [Cryptococcus neoformans var. grubii Br795]OXG80395.1 ribosomal RNA-processing protein 9 [Cryptococc
MPDPFFQSQKKRKRNNRSGPSASRQQKHEDNDENLSSDAEGDNGPVDIDLMDFREGREDVAMSDEEYIDENETAAEKRVRLAKGYLARVRDEVEAANADQDYDAADIDRELIASRLQKDVAEVSGRIHLFITPNLTSSTFHFIPTSSHLPTSATLTPYYIFISTKRGSIIRHSTSTLRRAGQNFGHAQGGENGHSGEILCLAASEDGKWLVSGGRDKVMGVWDVSGREPKWVTGLKGHKDAVTSIALSPLNNPSYHILSASLSRHLALHSLSTLSVIDTFFGHQDSIPSVSSLKPTLAVTAGSRDRSCRWWKVEEEVQLVFRAGGKTREDLKGLMPAERKERLGGGWTEGVEPEKEKDKHGKGREFMEGSVDCVCMLDDQHFVSGGDSGSLLLWHTGKKKPIFTQAFAHGFTPITAENPISTPCWITSIAALRGTNLFASGSWDGQIRLWALNQELKSFSYVDVEIPAKGFVNSLQLSSLPYETISHASLPESGEKESTKAKSEILLVAAVGQEPRLGRWMRDKLAKNGVLVARLELDGKGKVMMI